MNKRSFFKTVVSLITVLSLMILLGCDVPNKDKNSNGVKQGNSNNGETSISSFSIKKTTKKTSKKKKVVKEKETTEKLPDLSKKLSPLFDGITLAKSYKPSGNHNPLITQRFSADPYAMEYNGRLYVYTTNDILEKDGTGKVKDNSFSKISTLNVLSSEDLVNWTDHGTVEVRKNMRGSATKWAFNSWAPAACHKTINGKEKFFLYFANSAGSIGVLTSDSPVGPFTDPIGKPLISFDTPGVQGVLWCFDPAVLIDTDGKAYLYFGGGVPEGKSANPQTARVIQLGDDMTSTVGEAKMIDSPFMFEDSGINKIGNTYYYSYCSNWDSRDKATGSNVPPVCEICYMKSSSPMGPFTYVGSILKNPGTFFGDGGNNHHCMVSYKNKLYMFYHAFVLQKAMGIGGGYRSTQVDEVTVNADGTIAPIKGTRIGVAQLSSFDPYKKTEAETIAYNGGVSTKLISESGTYGTVNTAVTDINKGDWIGVCGVDFGSKGAKSFTAKVASINTGNAIKICLDSTDGPCVGYLEVPNTGADDKYVETTALIKGATGKHDLYFVFAGDGFQFDSWSFK